MTQATDYYPFGSLAKRVNTPNAYFESSAATEEGSNSFGQYYRYGYQGQYAEEDSETGWNSFQYRSWDPVVSRWMSTDPAGQYWSPYLGMGNNPVNQVDPDGRYSRFGAWWRSSFIPGSEHFYHAGEGEWAVSFQQRGRVGNSDLSAVTHVFTEGRIVFVI